MTDPVTYALNGVAMIGAGAVLICLLLICVAALIERRKGAPHGSDEVPSQVEQIAQDLARVEEIREYLIRAARLVESAKDAPTKARV